MTRDLSVDIEIADVFDLKPGEDLLKHAPFRISVAATVEADGESRLWYTEAEEGKPALQMDRAKAAELLAFLARRQAEGWRVFAWNGLSFDLRWIGYNAQDMDTAARVALSLYDPMFQFFNQRGFPVSLASVGAGLGIAQTKLMDSADAPREWQRGNYRRVMDYVTGDCQITNQIVAAIQQRGAVVWRTKSGSVSSEPMRRFKTVAEVLGDPEPDQSWMKGPGLKRSHFIGWIPGTLLKRC